MVYLTTGLVNTLIVIASVVIASILFIVLLSIGLACSSYKGVIKMLIKFKHLCLLVFFDAVTTYIGITRFDIKEANVFSNILFSVFVLLLE